MKTLNLALILTLMVSLPCFSQKSISTVPPVRNCGTPTPDPAWDAWFNQRVQEYIQKNYGNRTQSTVQLTNYTIPMVVHVLHNTSEAVGSGMNISQAQVNSQLTVLNQDYSATGVNISSCPSTFTANIANTGIQFCLAKIDNNGNTMAEPGIDRVDWQAKGWTDPSSFTSSGAVQTYFDGTIKPASIWDPNKYLNIWVADMSGSGLLGYATFPAGTSLTGLSGVETASTSGVVILTTSFGNTGNVAAPYNLGRTVTHEVGHWLGLRHVWGDGTCLTDYCNDTPPAQQANFGCPAFPHNQGVCSGNTTGEMTMDFMDYSDDACMYMFTNDQTTRIQTAMQTGTYRTQIVLSTVCNSPVLLDAGIQNIIKPANGSTTCINNVTPQVILTNYGSTTLTSCLINFSLDGAAATTYTWTGSLVSSATATITLPALNGLTAATHTYVATSASPNGGTDQNASNNSQTSVFTITNSTGQALPFTEGFEGTTFVPAGWSYTPVNTTNRWSRVTTASGFGTSTACAKMDNYSGTTTVAGQKDDMISPAVSFSNANSTIKLKFDVAYAQYNTTIDSLNIFISTDCGTTWNKIYNKGGAGLSTAPATSSAFTPTSTQWRKDSVSLSAYAGTASVKFKFESVSGWGNNVYLDNINLDFTAIGSAPVAAFSVSSPSVCVGQALTFTDQSTNTPTSWSWTMTGGTPATSALQNPTVTYSVAGTYSIALTATNGSGSSTQLTKTVTVNALPVVTASSASVCAGSSTALTASGASTYSWSTGANTSTVSVTPSVTTVYTVTGTSTAGCTKTSTSTVTVNALPVVTVSSASVCTGSSAILTASGASTYSWSTGTNTSTLSVTPSTTTVYTVTGTNTAGCTKTSTSTVTVNALPVVTVSSASVCTGSSAILTASGASTYSWSTGANTSTVSVAPGTTTVYTVTGTNTAGCTKTSTSTVTVNALPVITASSSTVCAGQPTIITAGGANTYTWNTGATSSSISVTPTSNTVYTVNGTDMNGCNNSATSTVMVNVNPSTPTITVSGNVLTSSSATGNQWYYNGTAINGSTAQTYTAVQNGTYYVVVTNSSGCSATSASVTVNSTGIAVNDGVQLNLFPNPSMGLVTLELNSANAFVLVEVVNSIGQEVYKEQISSCDSGCKKVINLSDLSEGIYLFRINTGRNYISKQILLHK
ncbi:MAG TPA: M43 family zinc metalloprotease [Bacteroidia bacterium]|jgi:PKD repeat protein|nr:M43 family zinc metalloprotease [Bacteroidia bacterium]